MSDAAQSNHPDPETLAAFAEGRLAGREAAAVIAHLDTCDRCSGDVALAMQAVEEPVLIANPRRWSRWILPIAAALALVAFLPVIRNLLHRSPVDRLVALSPKSARVVEPRLTGGFAWSPYRGAARSSATTMDAERLKLGGVAGELVERAQQNPTAEAQHDAGVAMLLVENAPEGIARLEAAAKLEPSARTWSDLAAARYAAASNLGRAALYPEALAAADAALQLDPKLPEALFNRALILERMGLDDEASRAWQRYLEVDASSQWANEARAHLADLTPSRTTSQFDSSKLETAATRGDATTVRAIVAEHPARSRAFAEGEYLGRWGEAALQKNDDDAARWLTAARAVSAALANESLLRDAVQVIDDQPAAQRGALASAHAAYRAGRVAYSQQKLDDALRDLGRAAEGFASARSPMSLAARYYLASVRLMKHDDGARAELERVLAEADAHRGYLWLRAHVRWELGRARGYDYDFPGAATMLTESSELFRLAGDRANEAFVEAMLARCLDAAGRGDDAWSSRIRALTTLSKAGNPARLTAAMNGAMHAEVRIGHRDGALALARLARPVAGDAEQLGLVLDAMHLRSMLESDNGQTSDAWRTANEASVLARSVTDPELRARRMADADVALGAALASSDPRAAITPLSRAVDVYRTRDVALALLDPFLLRARCASRIGDGGAAERDLEEGMRIVERHRSGERLMNSGILDAESALFAEAMRLRLGRGEDAAAFAIAERARGASIDVSEVQRRLAGSGALIVEIVLLPDEIVTFAISAKDFIAARRKTHADLPALADASVKDADAAATLYDELLAPVAPLIARASEVIVVPDARLECVPFAALYDRTTRSYLVEHAAVAIAPSAASLQREDARGAASVVTMTLPTGGTTGTAALPQAERELADVAAMYAHATTVTADRATLNALREALASADVVHVAGHTERQLAGGEAALLLAGDDSELARTSSRTLAALPSPRARTIVLAACETLRPPASPDTQGLSLGAALAAAGAGDVIGTLTPVADGDARAFFSSIHRELASGRNAASALRAAQLAAIGKRETSWRSIALLTRRISRERKS